MPLDRLSVTVGVRIDRDVACRARDGTVLRADVYTPRGEGRYPVLLIREPYNKAYGETSFFYRHPVEYARRGYVVVVQDARGCFRSEGEFYPMRHEAADGRDAVEWAARLPKSDGRVVMFGMSYPGAMQLAAASERPPSLVGMCPSFTWSQAYDGLLYRNGVLNLDFAVGWACFLEFDSARAAGDDEKAAKALDELAALPEVCASLPLGATWIARTASYFRDWLSHPLRDGYWEPFDFERRYGAMTVPALHVGGWYDMFVPGTIRNFRGLRSAGAPVQRLVVGPWTHSGDGPTPGIRETDERQLEWLDRLLHGRGPEPPETPVAAYVLGRGWQGLEDWPPPSSVVEELFLHSDGNANSVFGSGTLSSTPPGNERPDLFETDPLFPPAAEGGHSCSGILELMGPADQAARERSRSVLVYTTEALDRDLEIVGDVRLIAFVAGSTPDYDVCARLCLVDAAGRSRNLLEGVRRAGLSDDYTEFRPRRPGTRWRADVDLGPIAVRVHAGERLRLSVAGSDFPRWNRNLHGAKPPLEAAVGDAVVATQALFHSRRFPSRLELPVYARG